MWNADRTRYTVFFDPGRQKRGILPNREMGESLVAGRKYTLRISRDWLDGNGQPLRETFERRFTVGPPDRSPLDVAAWTITAPREGTRERADGGLPGIARSRAAAARDWRPARRRAAGRTGAGRRARNALDDDAGRAVAAGRYELIALGILEDLAGNRIGRAFEIVGSGDKGEDDAAVTSIPFKLVDSPG